MHISDLLYCEDEQFVWNCYNAILRRDPDPSGFVHNVQYLRQGRSRTMLIRSMRRSSEGRQRSVPIEGLRWAVMIARVMKLTGLRSIARRIATGREVREVRLKMLSLEVDMARLLDLAIEHAKNTPAPKPEQRKSKGEAQQDDMVLSPRGQSILDDLNRTGRND